MKYGWASDNVISYETILANGSITNVNYASHPDLFWAMRAGGNQFGIVTNFDVQTYEEGPVWGGMPFHAFSDTRARAEALGATDTFSFSSKLPMHLFGRTAEKLACAVGRCTTLQRYVEVIDLMGKKGDSEEDQYLGLYVSVAYMADLDVFLGCSNLVHSKTEDDPAAFKEFLNMKTLYNPIGNNNMTKMLAMVDKWQPLGKR
jgi:FAD/FMN-containing dehydrogenase